MTTPMSAAMRFFNMVSKPSDTTCWIWTGNMNPAGYGKFSPKKNESWYAHRFSYQLAFGPIPDGLTVDHKCYVTSCVNPIHLRLLTHLENCQGQRPRTHCPQGHEFIPENRGRNSKNGSSTQCKVCHRDRERKRRAAAIAARSAGS